MVLHEARDSSLRSQLMICAVQEKPLPLLEGARSRLTERIANGEVGDGTCPLSLLLAWYDPANYRLRSVSQGIELEFVPPLHLQPTEEETVRMQRDQDVLYLPMRSRRLIDDGKPPGDDGMEQLWARFDEFTAQRKGDDTEQGIPNAVSGIAAAAIILRPDWLKRTNGRYDKAVELIDAIAKSPPKRSEWGPGQIFDMGCDAFYADVAGTLYAREPENEECQVRVIKAATAYQYVVVEHLLRSFLRARTPEGSVPLSPLMNLVTQFAAFRQACDLDAEIHKRAIEELKGIAELFYRAIK